MWLVAGEAGIGKTCLVGEVESAADGFTLLHGEGVEFGGDALALGPFVVGGHTACIGCLAGRVSQRWGDPLPPEQPRAAGPIGARIAAGMIMQQLVLATAGRLPLINATVAVDLDSLESTRSPCLRSASCPHCAPIVTDGRITLPWAP